ncbi:hypothetical protein C1X21_18905 [Pseudomonas sp. FW305-3-2-15-A-LB2]|nr:hypothetical protein C1X17_20360 [Pseudomonas sp. FW305-3-2-15-C-TSA2]PMV24710.1 hypothetical protein C1X22_21125 [Pseudomonas sp. DP16D-L5]PMV37555.1 hypothetical protein C1X21_18905 [Pseudomonas sp. FW305-3-2-15-A-LB2]PMV43530.1 hypothetical protein C1X16_20285 [Pseudomonas sp. FW305-3-2-15-C-R2A1]PMV45424.1 hypothetical protein C1X18_24870 [Pseudomonas sp. FW305-3-2-15-C-LB1]PMV54360.1 hypothetical protein C1X19_18615 [Pseudomonas sp. GW460-4]PMV61554.1 hypothetical protein C1X20_18600 
MEVGRPAVRQKAPKRFKPGLRALNWHRRSRPSAEGMNRFSAAINTTGRCRQGFSASFSYLG